jgi:hypothetical protein
MKGEGPDSCAVLTATTSGHPLSGSTGAMEDHPTSIQVSYEKLDLDKIMSDQIQNRESHKDTVPLCTDSGPHLN